MGPLGSELLLHRILVGTASLSRTRTYFGPWSAQNPLLHYGWQDGTALVDSSTAQLRRMQVTQQASPHTALTRWETRLGCSIPTDIWQLTWLSFRSAVENTCLWQILYQVLATQKWRFPTRPAWDRELWCSRCSLGLVEDSFHCIWGCPTSRKCWEWGYWVIKLVSRCPPSPLHLRADHVLLAVALPQAWDVPFQLWHSIRAILCWLIWKDRNAHVYGGDRSDVNRIKGLAWNRLTIYMQLAWRQLRQKVRQDRLLFSEARALMADQFGTEGTLWSLHETALQVPPVPPRPP